MTGAINKRPANAFKAIATWAPKKLAIAPITNPPSAATPMHWPNTPRAVPRISGVADIKIMVLCMVLNPAPPRPTSSIITNDKRYQGEMANSSRLSN